MKPAHLFREYIWLINAIHRHQRLTFEELNQHWTKTDMSGGLPMARSSFNRHRDAILDMFGIIIDCDKKDGYRYYIGNAEVLTEDTIQNWMLSTLSVNNVLAESLGVHERILLERIPSDGEQLHSFINAMKQSVRIILRYRRYGAEGSSLMLLEPYLVKLFNKRWYALVRHPENETFFTLAFDRIISLELTDTPFEYDTTFDPAGWFRHCYGIVNDHDVPIEKVVIRAFGREPHYLRDLPLHHSQRELNATDEYTDFELTLRPTADFITPLLSRGAAIRVLSPQWLADTVKQCHLDAASRYE
ncbi:MAG: WYL domain-containing protein [Bacteroidaceae bacterium]|nr:WYL domain-containing protein [Bacteroidaceae bacterium]